MPLAREELLDALRSAMVEVCPANALEAMFETPRQAAHGDLAVTAAMALAKLQRKNPREVAAALVVSLKAQSAVERWVESIDVVGPGFINLTLRPAARQRIVADVRTWLPDIRAAARTRLDTRIAEIKQPLDPGRLEQELVMQLQKLDVDEELDRLGSHIAEARRILKLKEPSGRRLDFMMQEFNREANTLGSKSVDQRTTQSAVELKVLIEQIREQVQNIE